MLLIQLVFAVFVSAGVFFYGRLEDEKSTRAFLTIHGIEAKSNAAARPFVKRWGTRKGKNPRLL